MIRNFYNLSDESPETVVDLLRRAALYKRSPMSELLGGRQFGLLFLAASLRTRCSFEVGIRQLGGGVTTLEGGMFYALEMREGVRMDQDAAEHVREAVEVLSRFFTGLGIRIMAEGKHRDSDLSDFRYLQFERHATVPVFNMESAKYHPCQALADLLTIREQLGGIAGRRITITWAPHPRPLPVAVPNSILLAATQMGMHVTLAHPQGFELSEDVMVRARELAANSAGTLDVTHDQVRAFEGAEVVYAKSWGALSRYESPDEEQKQRESKGTWTVGKTQMARTANARFMHCLPVRRNVVVNDEVLDSQSSVVVDQAENRLHAQKAVLDWLYGE